MEKLIIELVSSKKYLVKWEEKFSMGADVGFIIVDEENLNDEYVNGVINKGITEERKLRRIANITKL